MKVFVRSRWTESANGHGYHWQPKEPEFARMIEADTSLTSDNFRSVVYCGHKIKMFEPTYSLLIRGLESGYQDHLARPISHTIVWEGDGGDEPQFRALILEAIAGNLSRRLAPAIRPDSERGFCADFEYIESAFAESREELSVSDDRRIDCSNVSELLQILRTQHLPTLNKLRLWDFSASAVLIAVGPGHSKLSQASHPYCRLTTDWYEQI